MRKLSKRSEEATNTVLTFATGYCVCTTCSCGCRNTCSGNAQADYYTTKAYAASNMTASYKSSWGQK